MAALQMQNLSGATFVEMALVFLNTQEQTYILHQILGLGSEEQNKFREMCKQIAKDKNKKKGLKGDDIGLPFFLGAALEYFEKNNKSVEQQKQEVKKIKTRLTILGGGVPRRETGLLHQMTMIMKKGLLNDIPMEDTEDLKEEIQIIQKEVKETRAEKFAYKDSAIGQLSFLKVMDGLSEEIRGGVEEIFKELKNVKSKLGEDIQQKIDSEVDPVIRS